MIKNVTLYFDDKTELTLIGDDSKIMDFTRTRTDIRGFAVRENWSEPDITGWDIKALKKLLEERS